MSISFYLFRLKILLRVRTNLVFDMGWVVSMHIRFCLLYWLIILLREICLYHKRYVCDISKKIQIGYAKIAANKGKYNRRALAKLNSTFCDHSVLYASGPFPLLNNGNLKRIRINYFKFCKFLLYLPPWTKNRTLVRKFSVPDTALKLEILHRKLSSTASARLSPHHLLIRFFR